MYRLFPEHAAAVKRSQEIADGCDIQLDFKKRHFPVYLPPDGKTPEDYLRELCAAGVSKRYGGKPSEAVLARLEHELGIICRMGFASYFLIVADFVRFAVEKRHPVQRPRLGVRGAGQLRPRSSATSIRWNTTCCSSASSTRTGRRRPTSTSTSARTAARR